MIMVDNKSLKKFLKEEDGLGTVEIVLLIAVLIAVALIFGKEIKKYIADLVGRITGNGDSAADQIMDTNTESSDPGSNNSAPGDSTNMPTDNPGDMGGSNMPTENPGED